MSERLNQIVTRSGDDGTTGLADGRRLGKHEARIEALGATDELNSVLGWLRSETAEPDLRELLTAVQNDLFDLGGELALPERPVITEDYVRRLEDSVRDLNAALPALAEFILPGGSRAAALAHVGRTVCRRAERRLVALGEVELLSPWPARYLNRLSDLLFVLARTLNRRAGESEPAWRGPARG